MCSFKRLKSGSDIRGVALGANAVLTEEVAARFGAGFASWRQKKGAPIRTVAIGRDSRVTGPALADALAGGLRAMGVDVTDFGLCTTPAMFMCLITDGFRPDAALMVTASHLPADRNGIKFILPHGGLSGEELDELIAEAETVEVPAVQTGALLQRDSLPAYQAQLARRIREGLDTDVSKPLLGLHILVDAGNGAGGFYASMLEELGAWTEGSQFLEPDGTFPNHIPNPEAPEAMASISAAVKKYGADLGVIFDTDCDRAAIVDRTGREINRNRLIALISAILLSQDPGATIVTDSVTSSGLAQFIAEWGGVHHRFKRGYRNVIDEAIRLNQAGVDCPLAIETSGHAALRENHFLDDGMYLVTLLIIEAMRLKQEGKELSSLLDGLREPLESVELRLPVLAEDRFLASRKIFDQIMDHATFTRGWHIAPDNREGIRINFDLNGGLDNGWFLIRLSVHDPVIPLNIESDVQGGLRQMAAGLYQVLKGNPDVDLSAVRAFIENEEE
ncbi:MAG: phosphomannomutase/phosphoglucomutase [Clostridia bacterium]|nr:phosphomannomutase/phosphoglucomutase [Clostridia bacterium]